MRRSLRFAAVSLLALTLALTPVVPARATVSRTVLIVFENEKYTRIIGKPLVAPYINSLASTYENATHFYAAQHWSLHDYLDVTAGDNPHNLGLTCGITPVKCPDSLTNIADQLEAAGLTWKDYAQDYPAPGTCDVTTQNILPLYESDHLPFLYYTDINTSAIRCANIVGLDQLGTDITNGTLPTFSFISPNRYTDMHSSCTIAPCPAGAPNKITQGDEFLKEWIPKILSAIGPGGRIIITWDESIPRDVSGCCTLATGGHIPTIIVGPSVPQHSLDENYDTYSILAGIESLYGFTLLANAGCSCTTALPL